MSSLEALMESNITLCPSCRSLQVAWAVCPVCRTYVIPDLEASEPEVIVPRAAALRAPRSGFAVRLPRLRAVKS